MAGSPVATINAQLGLDSTQFSSGLAKAQAELTLFGRKLEGLPKTFATGLIRGAEDFGATLRGVATGVPVIGGALSAMGVAGVAAGVGITAAAAALGGFMLAGRSALAFADEIGDSAQRIGTTTDFLQQMRYAVQQTGGEFKDADEALAGFSRSLGAAASGLSPKIAKAFTALGLDPVKEQAKGLEGALKDIADKVSALGTASEQAAVAEKLGLGPMLPLLRQGSAAIGQLQAAAQKLGIVMDASVVASAGDAHDKVEALELVTRVQLNQAMLAAAPLILGVASAFAEAAKHAAEFFGVTRNQKIADLRGSIAQSTRSLESVKDLGNRPATPLDAGWWNSPVQAWGWGGNMKGRRAQISALEAQRQKEQDALDALLKPLPPPKLLGGGSSLARVGGAGGGAKGGGKSKPSRTVEDIDAELALEEARARGDVAAEQRLKDQLDLRKRIREYEDAGLKPVAAQQAAHDAIARLQAAQADAAAKEVAQLQAAAGLDAARAAGDTDQVRVLEAAADLQERALSYQKAGRPLMDAYVQAARDQARIKEGEAHSQERARAEARLDLDIQVAHLTQNVSLERSLERQKELRELISQLQATGLSKEQATAQAIQDQTRLENAREQAARRWLTEDAMQRQIDLARTRGNEALANRLEQAQGVTRRIDDLTSNGRMDPGSALEQALAERDEDSQAKLSGLFKASFHDGVTAALDGGLGDFFQSWWKQHMANALTNSLDGLFNSLAKAAGGTGGGLGGIVSTAAKFFGGFAGGGSFIVGGSGGIDSNLATMRLTKGERVDITRPDQMREPGGFTYAPVIDARGADQAAVERLAQVMAAQQRALPDVIRGVVNKGLGTGKIAAPAFAG